jgi:hypothetical protein
MRNTPFFTALTWHPRGENLYFPQIAVEQIFGPFVSSPSTKMHMALSFKTGYVHNLALNL